MTVLHSIACWKAPTVSGKHPEFRSRSVQVKESPQHPPKHSSLTFSRNMVVVPSVDRSFKIIVFAAVVAVAFAAPPQNYHDQAVVVKETPLDNIGLDGYQFGYELSNGQAHQESAQLQNAGHENEALVVRGSFTYVDPETNVRYTVNYVADENGFHPEGAHLPVA
ncbi:Flexible cuticle protein 12 [Trachymyrmex septentrionalis]|uniref:Flexible cuticle protein 12 n=1 Tax=Trachymyrmex septentrionalis TaxID=34720 RepID=A0A151JU25_9HYME|nr:Flexible cuticle protein 12 [Trachymyrmex septentrionalis]